MNQDIINIINSEYSIVNREWKRTSTNRRVSSDQIIQFVTQSLTTSRNFEAMTDIQNISPWLNEQIPALPQVNVYPDEETYIINKVNQYLFKISRRGDKIWKKLNNGNVKTVDVSEIEVKLEKDLDAYNSSIHNIGGARKFKISTIKSTLRSMLFDKDSIYLAQLQDDIKFIDTNTSILDKWLVDLYNVMKIDDDIEIWNMLMKHMMWLVKRRIYGLPVRSDIWISIFGGQNVGKSYVFTKCLFACLSEYYVMTELSKIDDVDREIRKFTANFIINFDEIALGNSDDKAYKVSDKLLQNLKSILTRDELYVRKMGGQEQMRLDKTFVAVSSANTHLYDVIFDKTGMRRFFEFNCVATKQFDNKEVARLASISEDAWKGIDETLDTGYWDQNSTIGKKISDIQKSYRPKTNIDEWVTTKKIIPSDIGIEVQHAYTEYKTFCNNMGFRPFALPSFREYVGYKFTITDDKVQLSIPSNIKSMTPIPIKSDSDWDDIAKDELSMF